MKLSRHAFNMLMRAYRAILSHQVNNVLTGGRALKLSLFSMAFALMPFSAAQADYTPLEDGVLHSTLDSLGQGAAINDQSPANFKNVQINVDSLDEGGHPRTTTALNVQTGGTTTISGNFSVVNTTSFEGRYEVFSFGSISINVTFANNNNALYVQGNSAVEFSDDTESVLIAALGDAYSIQPSAAISAKNTNHTTTKGSNTVTVQGKKVQIIGDLDVGNAVDNEEDLPTDSKNTINLKLSSADSFWYGDQVDVSETNTVNLTLENGGQWIYRSDSSIQNLTLKEGGIVNLKDSEIEQAFTTTIEGTGINISDYEFSSDYNHYSVTIDNLSGTGGIFKMDLAHTGNSIGDYLWNAASDYITVSGSSDEGTHMVEFDADAANIEGMAVDDRIYFARVVDANAQFITNNDGVRAMADEAVDFVYATESEEGSGTYQNYWYFTRKGNTSGAYQPFMKGATFASYALATDLDRLNDRRGESRYVTGTNDGLWVRYAFSTMDWDNAFEMDKHMIQIGYDRIAAEVYGKHIFGVAVDYTHADIDIKGVSGDPKSERYALNLYYTWLTDVGIYTDLVLKGGIIESDYDVKNQAGTKIGSELDQIFYGASLETGWKFDFETQLFVEPQVQLQYMHVEGDDFTTDGGVKAKINDIDSFIGRAGVRGGFDFSLCRDLDSSFYIKADVLREFNADKGYYLEGRTTTYGDKFSGDQTWYDAGIGTDLSFTENAKLWIDCEHIFGGDFEDSWQVNAGVRLEF